MSGTVNLNSPTACYIDASGIHAPSYATIFAYLQTKYQQIYGTDVYLGNDSQDGELLGIFAAAINDANSATIAVYNAFSPSTAQGAGLSSVVKINGLQRLSPSNGNVDLLITGQGGISISNGIAVDQNNNRWFLPILVTIPAGATGGQITVTAIAENPGAISAPAGTITTIGTPTRGWQSVVNLSDATPGQPVQTDTQLRLIQSVSTTLPSQGLLDGIVGAIYQLSGVTRVQPYENSTSLVDINGLPPHSIALVVEGGSAQAIGNTIQLKKPPGSDTYGTTSVTVLDASGNQRIMNFFRPTDVTITVQVTLTPQLGFTTSISNNIVTSIINYLAANPIGANVVRTYLYAVAYNGSGGVGTFDIKDISLSRNGASLSDNDVVLAFNEASISFAANVTIQIG